MERCQLDRDLVAEVVRTAKALRPPLKPLMCKSCGAALFLFYSHGLGLKLKNECPVCGSAAVSRKKALMLSASFGGGVLLEAGSGAA